jgi:hypothetical protein
LRPAVPDANRVTIAGAATQKIDFVHKRRILARTVAAARACSARLDFFVSGKPLGV